MPLKLSSVLIILTGFLHSCILVPESVNKKQVDPKANPENVGIVAYSYDDKNYFPVKDTLWVSNNLFIKFLDGIVFDFEVSINGKVVIPFGNNAKQATIQKSSLAAQTNTMIIKQRVKSGTESLADKLSAEYAEFQNHFVVIRDDNTNFIPEITSISFENGSVRVNWNQFTRGDFQHYKISKLVSRAFGYQEYRSFIFEKQDQTSFLDSTYVGGYINYQIVVNNGGDIASVQYPFNYTASFSTTFIKNGDTYSLTFTPPPFHKNVKYYKTSFYNYNHLNNTQVITTNDLSPGNLSMNVPGPVEFGYAMKVDIIPVAKVSDVKDPGDQYFTTGTVYYGKKIKYRNGWYEHDINAGVYFCYVNPGPGSIGKMYRIDDTTFEAIDSASFPGGPGANQGNYVISSSGNYHYFLTSTSVLKFNPINLSVISTTPFSNFSAPISYGNGLNSITNGNSIFFSGYWSANPGCVVNLNTNTVVFSLANRTDQAHLSSDGTFLVQAGTVYRYSGGTYVFDQTLPYTEIVYRQFINSNPSQLFVATTSGIIIYDCQTRTQLFSAPVFLVNQIRFDQASGKVVGMDALDFGKVKVFDLAARTTKTAFVSQYSFQFSGDAFFSQQVGGYQFVLKDY